MEKGDWVRVNSPWSAYRDAIGRVCRVEEDRIWVTFKPDDRELRFDRDALIPLVPPEEVET